MNERGDIDSSRHMKCQPRRIVLKSNLYLSVDTKSYELLYYDRAPSQAFHDLVDVHVVCMHAGHDLLVWRG